MPIHNADDRIIAELDGAGNTLREYIYLDDLPVAVVEGGTALFWVHADHLKRPVKMLDAAQNVVWEALYEPFGTVHSIVGTAANDNRFPGQLFQLETGLAYNWHRHYDSTLGRYTQVDPLSTETKAELLHLNAFGAREPNYSSFGGRFSIGELGEFVRHFEQSPDQRRIANAARVDAASPVGSQAVFPDGPSRYSYVRSAPARWVDPSGLEACIGGWCGSGGNHGTNAMYNIGGKKLCHDCAVKTLGIQCDSPKDQVQTLRPLLIGGGGSNGRIWVGSRP